MALKHGIWHSNAVNTLTADKVVGSMQVITITTEVGTKVSIRQVSTYLWHVQAWSERWGWIDLTEPGHPVPLADARRIASE